jgi:hypothetical protein
MSDGVRLDPRSVEAVARRLVELIRDEVPNEQLIDAADVARRFGVARSWVYEHAAELGAVPLGSGTRPRLRFDPEIVSERLAARRAADPSAPPRPRKAKPRRRRRTGFELLPIKGVPRGGRS